MREEVKTSRWRRAWEDSGNEERSKSLFVRRLNDRGKTLTYAGHCLPYEGEGEGEEREREVCWCHSVLDLRGSLYPRFVFHSPCSCTDSKPLTLTTRLRAESWKRRRNYFKRARRAGYRRDRVDYLLPNSRWFIVLFISIQNGSCKGVARECFTSTSGNENDTPNRLEYRWVEMGSSGSQIDLNHLRFKVNRWCNFRFRNS